MASMALTDDGLRTVKHALLSRFEGEKSSHLTEALAAACGHRTHASLLAAIRSEGPDGAEFVLMDEAAFVRRLTHLRGTRFLPEAMTEDFDDLDFDHGTSMLRTRSAKFRRIDYSRSTRRRAWRNAMVAAINEAIERRLFSLRPGDNRWFGRPINRHRVQQANVFRFQVDGKIPAIASLWDAGWDEISVHVALWPTDEADHRIAWANAGFGAGEVFASGWLERRTGAWLQVSSESGQGWSFRCRAPRLETVAAIQVEPRGYADRGSFAV